MAEYYSHARVVANIQYDEADYIRDRAEFEQVCLSW